MRFHEPLNDVLGNPVRLRALRSLISFPERGFTGRELARICGTSPSQTIEALFRLEETGLVTRTRVGPSHLWRLEPEHSLVPLLTSLFQGEATTFSALQEELQRSLAELPVSMVTVFGSVARGDEGPASDIDLYIEVGSEDQVDGVERSFAALSARFAHRYGNALSPLVLSKATARRGGNPRLMRAIQRDGVRIEA